jgi:hypothetical protein
MPMTASSVQRIRDGVGDCGRLSARDRKAGGNVKLGMMTFLISDIASAAGQKSQ